MCGHKYVIRTFITQHSNADVTIPAGNGKRWSSRTLAWNFEVENIPIKPTLQRVNLPFPCRSLLPLVQESEGSRVDLGSIPVFKRDTRWSFKASRFSVTEQITLAWYQAEALSRQRYNITGVHTIKKNLKCCLSCSNVGWFRIQSCINILLEYIGCGMP